MENQIKNFVLANGYEFTSIENENSLKIIYNAFYSNIIDKVTQFTDSIVYLYYGMYFEINNKYDIAITYYKMSSDLGNSIASLYLGCIYGNKGIEKEMITYLTISANKGNTNAIFKLAEHFYSTKNVSDMEKWYECGVELNDVKCMVNLANYYKKNNIKITRMIELFNKAVNKKSIYAINNLSDYYESINNIELMVKYLKMSAELGYLDSYISLASYYQDIKDYDNIHRWMNNLLTISAYSSTLDLEAAKRGYELCDYHQPDKLTPFSKGGK